MSRYAEIAKQIEMRRDIPGKDASFTRFALAFAELRDVEFPVGGRGVVLVAGTNGKGTVSKTLETLLVARGDKVGLFTSPHLMKTTERIRSHGADLTDDEFVAAFVSIEPLANKFGLSHFEILTLMMCEVFFGGRIRPRVEIAIIEVGLGGRLDPTRKVPHEATIVTRLGLDHQALLGDTLPLIAREKFGAVDPGNLVVHFPFPPSVIGSAEWTPSPVYPSRISDGRWVLASPWGEAPLALMGARAVENSSLALAFLDAWGVDVASLLPALARVEWPGRMERFSVADRTVYLSGDHNLQGIESLRDILSELKYRELILVVGIGANKNSDLILRALIDVVGPARLILTQTSFRASGLEAYGEWRARAEAVFAEPVDALRAAVAMASPDDLILVTGSLYLVGDLRKWILHQAAHDVPKRS